MHMARSSGKITRPMAPVKAPVYTNVTGQDWPHRNVIKWMTGFKQMNSN